MRPVLRQPKAPRIGRCGTRAKRRKNHHGGRGAKPGKLHDTYFVSPGRTSKPKSFTLPPPCTPKSPGCVPGSAPQPLNLISPPTSPRAQRPNELSQLGSFLRPRAVSIISIPLGAPPRAPCIRQTLQPFTAGARQRCPLRFDLAVQRGALWALSMGLTLSLTLRDQHSFLVRRLEDFHGLLRTARQQGGSTLLGSAANNLIGDHC